ncbi:MAG: YpdA family putative bacillithiol disulfide reductase [Chitinophagaceae bacterium]|nr:YpdA family putative bacillithiol disulfide reductase [Chitinophagaceae bacterium]
MFHECDVVIIGAGPIGLACAINIQKLGLNYVVIDKGCLVNSLYHYPQNMTFFSTAERLEIGGLPFVCLQPKPGRAEALEYYRRVVVHFDLTVRLFEEVLAVNRDNEGTDFLIKTSKSVYKASKIIVATGFYDRPVALNVPGEELSKVSHYYKDPHFYAFQRVLVVGGNNSAVDAALECWRKGAIVSMVMIENDIGERVKYWVRPDIVNRIKEGSITAYVSSKVRAIHPDTVEIETPEGSIEIENDWVLAMTGYKPDFSFLEQLGVALSNDGKFFPAYNEQTMESNVQGLYLAGVVVGGMDTHVWFIENSRVHAEIIAADLKKKLSSSFK